MPGYCADCVVGSLLFAARERHGQPSRRLDVAEQHRGDGVAGLLARIPGLDHRGDLRQPRHEHRPGGVEHDDRARVRRGHRRDQAVLVARQRERSCGPCPRAVTSLTNTTATSAARAAATALGERCGIRRLPAEVERGAGDRRADRVLDGDRHRHAGGQRRHALAASRAAQPGKPAAALSTPSVSPLATRRAVDEQPRDAGAVSEKRYVPVARRGERAGPARRVRAGRERRRRSRASG